MEEAGPPVAHQKRLLSTRTMLIAALTAGALSGAPRSLHAQRAQTDGTVVTSFQGETPRVSFDYRSLFDDEIRTRMRSGLEVTVVMRTWLFGEDGGEAVGFAARSCRIAYEVWDENYRVELLDPDGLRTVSFASLDDVVAQCGLVRELPVRMSRSLRAAERYHTATVAEIDPLTPDMVARIQRWIARPGEAPSTPDAPGSTFFGSFVSLFVNPTVGEAERSVRMDSGPQVAP